VEGASGVNDIVLSTAKQYGYNEAQIDIIRQMAAQGCDDYELAQLLIVAHQTGLNPLLRQIYMIKRWNAAQRREVAMPQTSIDGYRATADRTGKYAPGREPTFTYNDANELLSATAYIKKLAGGTWHEVAATAYWSEYVQTSKDGKVFGTWAKMPHVMLSKCAEALAIRRAFPAELSGVYTADEMGQADNPPAVTVEPFTEPPSARPTKEQFDLIKTLSRETWGDEWEEKGREFVMFGFNKPLKEFYREDAAELIEALRHNLTKEEQPT
jgi:phage recombination protein Bet